MSKRNCMVAGVVIQTDGRIRAGNFDYQRMVDEVGGFLEVIRFGDGVAYLNEDGKGLQLPYNQKATELALRLSVSLHEGDVIVGNVVVVGDIDDDGNDTDISDAMALLLLREGQP